MASSEGIETRKQTVHLHWIFAFRPWLVTVEMDAVRVDDGLETAAKTETLHVFAAPDGLLQKKCFILPEARNSPVFSD